ncbi:MAG: serine/threonine-protein kinase [Planctomycetota bacterium]|nr:serine/threonine-protein kinase [Planctomycetota bacterium]
MSQESIPDGWARSVANSGDASDPEVTRRPEHDAERTQTLPPALESSLPSLGTSIDSWHSTGGSGSPQSRFIPQGSLGRGGMGEVLLARQPELARDVAIKVLHADHDAPHLRHALRQEACISGRLDHPNVVPVHDVGHDYLVMRHVRGRTFSAMLADKPSLPEAIEVLRKVCDAIAYAHNHGVLHRDLKPANIMVGAFGEVQVMDWGLALQLPKQADGTWGPPDIAPETAIAGTPSYLAPEMARGLRERLSPASDVYLLGAVLYRIMAGRAPHRGPLVASVIANAAVNEYPALDAEDPKLPQRLIDLQRAAMQTDPAERPNVDQFREGLVYWLRSVDDERTAMVASARGHRHLQAATAADHTRVAYREYARAMAAFEQSLSAWSACAAATRGRAQTCYAYTRQALAQGDLQLAQSVAAAGHNQELEGLVAQAQAHQRRSQRHAVVLRITSASLWVLLLGGLIGLIGYAAQADHREQQRRLTQAQQLLADPAHANEASYQHTIARAYQALGLAGTDTTVRQAVAAHIARYATWAEQAEQLHLAANLVEEAASIDPSDPSLTRASERISAKIDHDRMQRAALVTERRAQLRKLVSAVHEARHAPNWRDNALANITAWDGPELKDAVLELIADPDPIVRRLAAAAVAQRPDWRSAAAIAPLLNDPDANVAEQARNSLAALDDNATRHLLTEAVERIDDDIEAWLHASTLPSPVAAVPAPTDANFKRQAQTALRHGDPSAYLALMDQAAALTTDDLRRMSAVSRWHLCDLERARSYATHINAPDDSAGLALNAALAFAANDLSAVRASLAIPTDSDAALRPLRLRLSPPASFDPAIVTTPNSETRLRWANALRASATSESQAWGRRLYAEHDAQILEQLDQLRGLLEREQHETVHNFAAALLCRDGPHRELMASLARSQLARGHITEATGIIAQLRQLCPDDETGLFLEIDLLCLNDEMSAAAERIAAWINTAAQVSPQALERAVVLAHSRTIPQLHQALARLATTPHLPRQRPLLVRALIEQGLHARALDLLQARTRLVEHKRIELNDAGDPTLRYAFDQFLLSVPSLRERGWPGMHGPELAALLLEEALIILSTSNDTQRVRTFTTLARGHAGGAQPHHSLSQLLAALADGRRDDARSLLETITELPPTQRHRITWLPEASERIARHLSHADTPLTDRAWTWQAWPRQALQDCQLSAADRTRLITLWQQQAYIMPPPTLLYADGLHQWDQQAQINALDNCDIPLAAATPSWDAMHAGSAP